ncbi:hypothetical protein OIU85_002843 [Salix viminalis]|uniref:Leucine-rich repeat-containing N-terminal plant-type domain-containing protein n=1 Tax=Salix viminalis TaxID=40686 RepID=A0A9Q0VP97_SALVM|nr:hypothetical protein OIU85_002843 [Salix viminalis]
MSIKESFSNEANVLLGWDDVHNEDLRSWRVESRDLSDNLLYGDIPFSISRLKRLDTLNLKSNRLTVPIPSTLTQLSKSEDTVSLPD